MFRCALAVLLVAGVALGQRDKPAAKAKPPDLPGETADDTAEMKLARKVLVTQLKRLEIIGFRMDNGNFADGTSFTQATDALQKLIEAVDDLFPEAKDRVAWYEYRLVRAKELLDVAAVRVEKGLEEAQVKPQLEGSYYKAELALLKLKKQIKK